MRQACFRNVLRGSNEVKCTFVCDTQPSSGQLFCKLQTTDRVKKAGDKLAHYTRETTGATVFFVVLFGTTDLPVAL